MTAPWERDWGQSAPVQQGPVAIPIPQSARDTRDERRADDAAGREAVRTGIAARGEGRDVVDQAFDHASKLRMEFKKLPQVTEYQTVIRQYNQALGTQATPTGDQALITAYAKMLDPGSVVREQEFNTVAAGDSTIGQIVSRLNKELGADQAGLLRPEVRQRVRDEMQNLVVNYNDSYNQARQEYGDLASSYNVDPVNVVGEHYGQPYLPKIQRSLEAQGIKDKAPAIAGGGDVTGGLTGTVTDDRPTAAPGTYGDSALSQGLSGVNEGIAGTLGLPIDLLTGALNLVPRGINAVANTDLPTIDKPFLGGDWFKGAFTNLGAIGAPSADPDNQFVRRVGQSVGANAVPAFGLAKTPLQAGAATLSGLTGGLGGATAQRVAPGNVGAEMLGEMLGSGAGLGGAYSAARRSATREMEMGIPTVEQLKDQAGTLYRQAEARGVVAEPMQTQELADNLRATLRDEGLLSPAGNMNDTYAKAQAGLRLVDDYAGNTMNPTQMQTVRRIVAEGQMSPDRNERRVAGRLLDTFDDWATPMAPELPQARDIASRYLNTEQLERARNLAGAQASQFSGSGFENALRTQYRALDRDAIKGKGRYSMDLNEAIQAVSRGTPGSNAMRNLGKLAPTGVVSGFLGSGGPALVGHMIAGPPGAVAAGAGAGGLGIFGRVAATKMGIRNADKAELIARNGGSLPEVNVLDTDLERLLAATAASQAGQYLPERKDRKRGQR